MNVVNGKYHLLGKFIEYRTRRLVLEASDKLKSKEFK